MVELIYALIFCIIIVCLYKKDKSKINDIKKTTFKISSKLIPYVIGILLIASIIDVYMPKEIIRSYLGKENGIVAIIIAAILGSIFEGPTIIAFVLGANFINYGASVGAATAFIASFSMVGLVSLPLEIKELGRIFAVTRLIVTLFFTIIVGCLVEIMIW